MCLGTKLSDTSLRRYKAKGKKLGYIRVWKTVDDYDRRYRAQVFHKTYKVGLNHSRKDARNEDWLIHAFRDYKSARKWSGTVVQAMVKPEWVKALGNSDGKLTLTTKAIVMPEYPKRKVTVREFRAAIKGKKVKKYSWE